MKKTTSNTLFSVLATSFLATGILHASEAASASSEKTATVTATATVSITTEAPVTINPDEINAISKPEPSLSATELIEKEKDAFLKKHNIYLGPDKKGRHFYFVTQPVDGLITSSDWPRARVNAYDKAVVAAQKEFLGDFFRKTVAEVSTVYFSDRSSDAGNFSEEVNAPSSTIEAIWEKTCALTEAKLDQKLVEAGVDPSAYDKKSLQQKRTVFLDQIVSRSLDRAIGSIAGLTIIQTFSGKDTTGQHAVGLIAMYSPVMKQLAYDINHKREPMLSGKPSQDVRDYIPSDQKTLSETLGIRIGFDSDGSPCVISFGQWASAGTGSNARDKADAKIHAERQARRNADRAIAFFQAANMTFLSEGVTGQVLEKALVKDRNGYITNVDTSSLIDTINERSRALANVDGLGCSTLKKWNFTTKEGHLIVGEVRAWTVAGLKAGENVRNWKPDTKPKSKTPPKSSEIDKQTSGVNQGAPQNLADF